MDRKTQNRYKKIKSLNKSVNNLKANSAEKTHKDPLPDTDATAICSSEITPQTRPLPSPGSIRSRIGNFCFYDGVTNGKKKCGYFHWGFNGGDDGDQDARGGEADAGEDIEKGVTYRDTGNGK